MRNLHALGSALSAVLDVAPPGRAYQLPLCPPWRRLDLDPASPEASSFRRAAVLLLLYQGERGPSFPLILRTSEVRHHAGQVALPGGAVEDGESAGAAALRETEEELGVDVGAVSLVGSLTPFPVDVSRFVVTPWIALAPSPPVFKPSPSEVSDWFPVGVEELLDPDAVRSAVVPHDGGGVEVPCFTLSGRVVWGATAIALAEFAEALRRADARGPA